MKYITNQKYLCKAEPGKIDRQTDKQIERKNKFLNIFQIYLKMLKISSAEILAWNNLLPLKMHNYTFSFAMIWWIFIIKHF